MRRLLSIFLALLVWTTGSGLAAALHHAEASHDSAAPRHDESTCQICVGLHAPVPAPTLETTDIVLERQTWSINLVCLAPVLERHALAISCRGPPAC